VSQVPTTLVPYPTLSRFAHEAAERMGLPAEDAAIFADVLVSGSLRSVPGQGQGVQAMPSYWSRMQRGVVNRAAAFEVVRREGSTALADAHDGSGHVMSVRAMNLAIEIATEMGVGVVGVRHSTHFGIAAYYPMLAMRRGLIGLAFSNASPEIAPWGGTRATVGTNPWAAAIPTGEEPPVVLDMANSTSGKGMIGWYLREGMKIPGDWALTAEGERTEDPEAGMSGTLFPLGGAKGYAMAVIVDAITGVLTGSAFGLDAFGADRQDVGHLMMAIDIARFLPLEEFRARMDALIAQIRSSPLAPGTDAIYLPGELEHRREVERRRDGVPIANDRLAGLRALGDELQVPTSLPEPVPA
jgi:LDH2 family malate/lactate/ureidoglycolate dehydrogenase